VFVISAYQESTFGKKPFDLRDKRILNFERDKVDLIEVAQRGSPAIQIARAGSEWILKSPIQARGDYSAVEGLLTRISSARMTRLIDGAATPPAAPDLAKYGLDQPGVTTTVGAGSTRATLVLGREEEGAVYARDQARPLLFTVEPSLATDLKKAADEYRDKDLFEFRSFNADRLRIVRGAEAHDFVKVRGTEANAVEKWQRQPAGGSPLDVESTKMDDLLSKVSNLRAQSFVSSFAGTGLDEPALVIAASYDQGKFERVMLARPGADAYASRQGEPGAAKLDATAYDDVLKALDAVVAPAPQPAAM
jgi:hypothetical protein